MIISVHYDEKFNLLVLRHGESFVGDEGQSALVDFVREHKQVPTYFILDTREVKSSDLKGTDRANLAHTDRQLMQANPSELYTMKLIGITPPDPKHPMNQRFQRMLSNANATLKRNDTNQAAIVHTWEDALVEAGLPRTLKQPY